MGHFRVRGRAGRRLHRFDARWDYLSSVKLGENQPVARTFTRGQWLKNGQQFITISWFSCQHSLLFLLSAPPINVHCRGTWVMLTAVWQSTHRSVYYDDSHVGDRRTVNTWRSTCTAIVNTWRSARTAIRSALAWRLAYGGHHTTI